LQGEGHSRGILSLRRRLGSRRVSAWITAALSPARTGPGGAGGSREGGFAQASSFLVVAVVVAGIERGGDDDDREDD
jgi:hypothetical protein